MPWGKLFLLLFILPDGRGNLLVWSSERTGSSVQLYKEFFVSEEKTGISLPSRNYSCSPSFSFFSFTSDFYFAFLRHSPACAPAAYVTNSIANITCVCQTCLKDTADLRFDMSFTDSVSLVRLCGYLLIKPNVVHAFLANLMLLDEVLKSIILHKRFFFEGPHTFFKVYTICPFIAYWRGFALTYIVA